MKIIEPSYEILTQIDGEEVLRTLEKELKTLIPIVFDDIEV